MEDFGHLSVRDLSPPERATQLGELFGDPDRGMERVVAFLSQHPELAAETLRRSNSVAFAGLERTDDIYQAVNRLGFHEIQDIIAAARASHAWGTGPSGNTSHSLD